MLDYKVTDNFLSENDYQSIKNLMLSVNFPWFYNPSVATDDETEKHFQFTHMFYKNYVPHSEWFRYLEPLVMAINPTSLIRIKANLGGRHTEVEEQGFHTDFEFECRTAVYYLNTNNGYTIFEDGTKVESVGNRLVEFNSLLKHSGTSHTDTKVRSVINLNYYR